jgi:putative nucleotidyltransferase with HDIG domain
MATGKVLVNVSQLKIGMFVSDLDRPWLETPFVFQGFRVQRQQDIDNLHKYCEYVTVDIEKSITVTTTANYVQDAAPQPTVKPQSGHTYQISSALESEIKTASELRLVSRQCIDQVFEDISHGKKIDLKTVKSTVNNIMDGILRNPDAHLCMTHMKNRDEYTAQHSINVCVLSMALARHVGLHTDQISMLGVGALLHDIGKIKTPLEILNKPDKLTEQEFDIMKSHPQTGRQILERFHELPMDVIDIAFSHHERMAGGGYPRGIRNQDISYWSKLVSIVDVYDAITSDRCYHKGMSPTEALTRMYSWRLTDFDPILLEQFIQCIGIYPIGTLVELTSGEVGIVIAVNPVHRLRPKLSLVLSGDKQPIFPARVVDLARIGADDPEPTYGIVKVLAPGSFNINVKDQLSEISRAQLKAVDPSLFKMA